ncbi:tolA [Wigglesworthia glossinidia endosymbiont of Glossina brevipalpis]|uniref:TolA protein n=1 Tax=Wigglesworthia glossinidia brevipalpis TaxID=36870 RepID=Q8D2E1_WIGBR|nr:tolA [Wigglesworthia glossinidia endosymbiont of Glossina brevipalpis]
MYINKKKYIKISIFASIILHIIFIFFLNYKINFQRKKNYLDNLISSLDPIKINLEFNSNYLDIYNKKNKTNKNNINSSSEIVNNKKNLNFTKNKNEIKQKKTYNIEQIKKNIKDNSNEIEENSYKSNISNKSKKIVYNLIEDLNKSKEIKNKKINDFKEKKLSHEVENYKSIIQQAIKNKLYDYTTFKGKTCEINIEIYSNGSIKSIYMINGSEELCHAAISSAKSAKIPPPPNITVYEIVKKIKLKFNPE